MTDPMMQKRVNSTYALKVLCIMY